MKDGPSLDFEIEDGCFNGASGSIYNNETDALYLNNERYESSRFTKIKAHQENKKAGPDAHTIASIVYVGDYSKILV